MRCTAIGDMLIKAKDFQGTLEKSRLFSEISCFSWKEDMEKDQFREVIRKIETEGSAAFDLENQMKEAMKNSDVIMVHLCPINREIIKSAKRLKYILTCRGGVENIDMKAAKECGIKVMNCPSHNAYAVAEYTIGLILSEMRNISRAYHAMKCGVWRESFPNSGQTIELRSAVIGIVGFGTIGRLVAERLKGFGTKILINDPFILDEEIKKKGYIPVTKEELVQTADVITIHGRIGKGEPPIIGREELEQMKPSAYLINTARAVAVDMEALYEALKERKIMGAAIDVFDTEPIPKTEPLLQLDNVTFTNHQGGATIESYIKAPEMILEMFQKQ